MTGFQYTGSTYPFIVPVRFLLLNICSNVYCFFNNVGFLLTDKFVSIINIENLMNDEQLKVYRTLIYCWNVRLGRSAPNSTTEFFRSALLSGLAERFCAF